MVSPWLDLDGPSNFRDLGGTPVAGGIVRDRRLYRSDSLVGLSDRDRSVLAALGLGTVIDLRSDEEVANGVSELIEDGVTWLHSPIGGRLGSIVGRGTRTVTMAEGYVGMLRSSGPSLVAIIETLSSAGSIPAVFHCAGGKDRSGIVAATILSVLGASPDVIADEYSLTGARFNAVLERLNVDAQYSDVLGNIDRQSLTSDKSTMYGFLEAVERDLGGMTRYLAEHGLTDGMVAGLRETLVA